MGRLGAGARGVPMAVRSLWGPDVGASCAT